MKETVVTIGDTVAKSETAIVRSLNSRVVDAISAVLTDGVCTVSISDFVYSVSMLILMSAMRCLTCAMRCSTSALGRLYGLPRLLSSSISFSIFATASPVASPVFSGCPLSSFCRSCSNLR
jgi:hypothetical protein